MDRKRKNTISKIFFNQFTFFIIGLFVLAIILFPLSKKVTKQYRLNQEISDLNNEIERLEGKNNEFKSAITYLESQEFTEEEARINLNLKKEGEEVVVIKSKNSSSEKTANNLAKKDRQKSSNPINWWNYFLK